MLTFADMPAALEDQHDQPVQAQSGIDAGPAPGQPNVDDSALTKWFLAERERAREAAVQQQKAKAVLRASAWRASLAAVSGRRSATPVERSIAKRRADWAHVNATAQARYGRRHE